MLFPLYREITKQTVCPTSLMHVQHKEIVEFISTLETQQHTGFELATVKLLGDYLLKHNAYEEKILYPAIEELSHGIEAGTECHIHFKLALRQETQLIHMRGLNKNPANIKLWDTKAHPLIMHKI